MHQYQTIFNGLHSTFRYLVLISVLVVMIQSLMGMQGKKTFTPGNRKAALLMQIFCDIQLLLGLAVYYFGGHLQAIKEGRAAADHYSRFYNIEHPVSMLLGIVLVHLAYGIAKKSMDSAPKFKRIFWYTFIALFLFVAQTPWPGKKDIGRPFTPSFSFNQ